MKCLSLFLALLTVLGALAGCSGGARSGKTEATASAQDTRNETAAPVAEGIAVEDFTVQTADGGVFTLSEALRDHELVLINLFATWCGPCEMEFPYLQQAWLQNADRVSVIALSVEPDDTNEILRSYAAERGLTFPMGREEGTGMSRFMKNSIPTTVLVDRTGKVAAVEVGAKMSTEEFLELFDGFTGDHYDPNLCTYTFMVYTGYHEGVEGAVINVCTDTACTPVTTDKEGVAVFTGVPAKYHVQIVSLPKGLRASGTGELTTQPYGQTFYLKAEEEG